jgi:hypothetical protein
MEYSEIKKLIPFYIAGTLEPEEKKLVEDALGGSDELGSEFAFWLKVREVVAQHSTRLTEQHLTPEQIIGYIEDNYLRNIPELEIIESHIKTCADCRLDIETLRNTYPHPIDGRKKQVVNFSEKPVSDNRLEMLLSRKFVDVFAIAAVILIIVLTLLTTFNIGNKIPLPEKRYKELVLLYQNYTRGDNREEPTILVDDSLTAGASVLLTIPHSEIDSLRYDISLKTSAGIIISIATGLKAAQSDTTSDTLHFLIDRNIYSGSVGDYIVTVKEILPKPLSHLTPELYCFTFKIQKYLEK